ncbi:MAG: alpha-L-rhamnosidase, partial [Clostridiales bacterium]|nr:alpha-L-rhamnosidase [Clostridiales bacterium]
MLCSALETTGELITGNSLVNQLVQNAFWGQIGNFLDVPTDCPQRDERMGWTGDAQVFAPTACYQQDSYAFFSKYLYDLATEQNESQGEVPRTVPSFGRKDSSAAWGDAACIIPWVLYEYYGDKAILKQQFSSMCDWVDFVAGLEKEGHGWREHFHFGDWLGLDGIKGADGVEGGTNKGFIALTYLRYSAQLTARAAKVLGMEKKEAYYNKLAEGVLYNIRNEYFTPTERCAVSTQTALLLSLRHGLTKKPSRTKEDLAKKLEEAGGMLQTGFVGTPILLQELTYNGMVEQAFNLLLNEEYPGWLYGVKLGATTIWERWNSVLSDGSISGTDMNSLNHYAYGSIVAWLYGDVAGISPLVPGFRKAALAPHLHCALSYVKSTYQSAAGTWETSWKITSDGRIDYRCVIPFGCTAHLVLPYGGGEYDLEAGEFQRCYTPNQAIRKAYSVNMPIGELLANPRVAAILKKMMPKI